MSTNSNFTTTVLSENLNTTSFRATQALNAGQTYYWRVSAMSSSCPSGVTTLERSMEIENCLYATSSDVPVTASGFFGEATSDLPIATTGNVREIEVINLESISGDVSGTEIELSSPNATRLTLFSSGNTCNSTGEIDLHFSDNGSGFPSCPFNSGDWVTPSTSLSNFKNTNLDGTWQIIVTNNSFSGSVNLNNWGLRVCPQQSIVLPVEWLHFSARPMKDHIELEWNTAREVDNAGFDIERRAVHEVDFRPIGWIDAALIPSQNNQYHFQDRSARPGIQYYYRLRQVDYSGTDSYSAIRSAILDESRPQLHAFPNPAFGKLQIQVHGVDFPTEVQIVSLQGQVLRKSQVTVIGGLEMDLNDLPQGIYLLQAATERGWIAQKITVL